MISDGFAARRERFAALHASGCFVLPNAWDVGSARILAALGYAAVATTSSGHAHALGRLDQQVSVDELLDHVSALVAAIDVPVSVDAEDGFAEDPDGVARLVDALAERGAAGLSLEDYRPGRGLLPHDEAVERVAAAAEAARPHGLTLTARAENHLYGVPDLDDTVARLVAYRDAGADVLYAPGLADPDAVRRVVAAVGTPVNVLLLPAGPTVPELAALGVRRVSTGGWLARAAYGALARAARELRDEGTAGFLAEVLTEHDRAAAFDARRE
ncbi:MAG: isocitrate lyase/phosphoenolpyruvate mutase family protein [Actinomycetales bacterium]